jgi:hypothetical protein
MRTDIRTFTDGRDDLRRGAKFLGALLAIPVAGVLGLPLLILLLLLFGFNPGGLGQSLGRSPILRSIPGFRSGHRVPMMVASVLYLLPISLLGMAVVGVDGMIWKIFP